MKQKEKVSTKQQIPLIPLIMSILSSVLLISYGIYPHLFFRISIIMCFITFIIPIMANYFICVLNQNKADTQNDRIMKEVHSYIRAQKYIESVAKKNYKNNIKPTKEYKYKKVDNNNYTQLRNLIATSCKQKQISRQSILSFVEELNKILGNNVNHYSKMTFENDLHEIYVKLKSSHLQDKDYIYLKEYLNKLIQVKSIC